MAVDTPHPDDLPPDRIQDFMFLRELSEVYLLLDHLSGRSDKQLSDSDLAKAFGTPLPTDWLERICLIGWPPAGEEMKRADQAATLLRAKDVLNTAARPASGATIAFTLLVSGEDNADAPSRQPLLRPLGRLARCICQRASRNDPHDSRVPRPESAPPRAPFRPAAPPSSWGSHPPSRRSLARLAYPGLVGIAHRFTWQIRSITLLLLAWLVITCSLSWNVAAGQAIFRRVDILHKNQDDLLKEITSAEANAAKQNAKEADNPPSAPANSIGILFLEDCVWNHHPAALDGELKRLMPAQQVMSCDALSRDRQVNQQDLADWLASWRWLKGISRLICRGPCLPESADSHPPPAAVDEQWAAIVLEVLASAVLPLCYGFLGAGAAVVRDLWNKMRESLLSPRDLTLALGQLALGAVIGASIGLFIAPANAQTPGTNGFTGTAALTASALSFIAGFGVEGVFVAMESLIKRIFNLPGAAKT
jgi:hypothetical protein